jgi:hypothetical protein
MPRETWAVHSVRDHLAPYPFVVDCLLYDRVRVPVPADDDRDRWVQREWDPARLDRFTQVLGDRARTLEWDAELRNQWRSSYLAAQRSAQDTAPDAFKMTRTIVVDSLPRDVTGVDTVSAYTDFADMRADAGRYRKNRRAYWRWVREFTAGTVTGEEALADGLSELQDLVQDQRDLARSAWVDRSVRMGFLLGTVTLGIVATPLTPVVAVGAALALGQFAWTELWNRQQAGPADTQVGAMFCTIDERIRKQIFVERA